MIAPYRKFIVAIVGFLVLAATAYFGTDVPDWFNPLVGLLSALGVYQVRNDE